MRIMRTWRAIGAAVAIAPCVWVACATQDARVATSPAAESSGPTATEASVCDDMLAFRARELLRAATSAKRDALTAWQPPKPVRESDKEILLAVARDYLAECGLLHTQALTQALVRFPTVSADGPPKEHPAFLDLAAFLRNFAEKNGLGFNVSGEHDAWEVTLGDGPPSLGFVLHADVVPVREAIDANATTGSVAAVRSRFTEATIHPPDWQTPPFDARIVDGRLYGRGTEDDKGPIASVLVVLRTLKAMGLAPTSAVVAVLGTEEENDWDGMERYAGSKTPPAKMISVDAGFPVVVAESGFVAWRLGLVRPAQDGAARSTVAPKIVDAKAGQFLTQVPGTAIMHVAPGAKETAADLARRIELIAREVVGSLGQPFRAEVEVVKDRVEVRTFGSTIHSSEADEGHNALWALSLIASKLSCAPTSAGKMLEVVARYFANDHYGARLGLDYAHEVMGPLLVTPTVLRTSDAEVSLSVNMRRPAGKSKEEFVQSLRRALSTIQRAIDRRIAEKDGQYVGDAALTDPNTDLVTTLLEVYQEHMNTTAKPISIRGGTYARLFPGAVSFGPSFPGQPYRGHAADEYIELENLDRLTKMLFDVTVRLTAASASASGSKTASQ